MDMPGVTDVSVFSSCSGDFRNTIGWFNLLFVALIDSLLIILSRGGLQSFSHKCIEMTQNEELEGTDVVKCFLDV